MSLHEKRCGRLDEHAEHVWYDQHGKCFCDGASNYERQFVEDGDRQSLDFELGAYNAETDIPQSEIERLWRDWGDR